MRLIKIIIFFLITFNTSLKANSNNDLQSILKEGGKLIFIRHAYAPGGGDPDINVHSATEGTGVEDGAIGDLTETLLVNAGDATTGSKVYFTGVPAADQFLYLTTGAATDADYSAGKLFIELMGYEA